MAASTPPTPNGPPDVQPISEVIRRRSEVRAAARPRDARLVSPARRHCSQKAADNEPGCLKKGLVMPRRFVLYLEDEHDN